MAFGARPPPRGPRGGGDGSSGPAPGGNDRCAPLGDWWAAAAVGAPTARPATPTPKAAMTLAVRLDGGGGGGGARKAGGGGSRPRGGPGGPRGAPAGGVGSCCGAAHPPTPPPLTARARSTLNAAASAYGAPVTGSR
jgi:translation initiation factor IF-2